MANSIDQRIEELQDQIDALQQLLLSHVVAFDQVDRLATDGAFDIAASQMAAARARGRPGAAHRIGMMLEQLEQTCDAVGRVN